MKIRKASINDVPALLEIYAPYVRETAISFEYEVPTAEEFAGRIETISRRYPYLVLEDEDGTIAGYAYASAFKGRAAYDWSVETTIYIRKEMHGKGYGKILYQELERCLKAQNILNANACIAYAREDNDHLTNSSMYFHEKMGYTMVGTFHSSGYKFGQWYDMIWMEKMLGEHTGKVNPFIPFPETE